MHILDTAPSIFAILQGQLKECRSQVKACPWFVHVHGNKEPWGSFTVSFSLTDSVPYRPGDDSNVLAFAYCRILPDTQDGRVMMEIHQVRATKHEFDTTDPKKNPFYNAHEWYKQDWRLQKFIMECEAGPLWNLLERCVDFDRLNLSVVRDVLEE